MSDEAFCRMMAQAYISLVALALQDGRPVFSLYKGMADHFLANMLRARA